MEQKSITDELRKYTEEQIKWLDMTKVHYSKLFAIADRIDAEHQKVIRELNNLADASVLLPVDADGEYIRIGDVIDCGESTFKVNELRLTKTGWNVGDCRHHKPTVEDVLAEMLDAWGELPSNATNEAIIAEYAKKLQLRKETE